MARTKQTAEEIEQMEIPGTASKQEAALEEEIDAHDDLDDQITELRKARKAHKGNVDRILIKLGRKKVVRNGWSWERNMKLTRTAEKDADADVDGQKSEKTEKPETAAAAN